MIESTSTLREAVRAATHAPEPQRLEALLAELPLAPAARAAVHAEAVSLVRRCRGHSRKAGTLDAFLQEFGLSNQEGIALMCLAEALLRVPDEETADRLIAEKIHGGDWGAHRGQSASRFVNASVWGLMLTGRIVRLEDETIAETDSWMRRLVGKLGEPVVRQAVLQAMRIMGGQYVLGRSIAEALQRGVAENRRGTRFSFDMLGEGARTDADAQRYFEAYADAIRTISTGGERSELAANGISVKLSALHPRYAYQQAERVREELLPRIRELALMAARGRLALSIDAEECDRLDLSMELFEALARDPALAGWDGLGFVLQGYQKRACLVADWLVALGRETGHRLPVRLVKGAYWDSEIKHAQEQGLADYPVFTRKCHSDLSYESCAARLLAAPDAIYPQFATHNAHTVAVVRALAGDAEFEFQRLHGMGQLLYDELQAEDPALPVRVYAPVGNHRDLLPYLVRRLLENGANSSFVNRFLDARVAPEELLRDPLEEARELPGWRHTRIPVPRELYGTEPHPWKNARGIDLADPRAVAATLLAMAESAATPARATPIVAGCEGEGEARPVFCPAAPERRVGEVIDADGRAVEAALAAAHAAQPAWDATGVEARAACLERLAETLETHCETLMGLLAVEGGRTVDDSLSEVREAVDFCRYYAQQACAGFAVRSLPGPTGEVNELSLHGRGVFACISPWNFPLAIFTGQVVAALVAGNSVVAKPAEQTPLVAAQVVRWAHAAGVPAEVLALLPGEGAVGAALVADPRVAGVAFTGGTDTARSIQRRLAERDGPIVPLIAETGGLNCMLVDATALPQADIAERVLDMLAGAMRELRLGDPLRFDTDIGPVIDLEARQKLERHAARMDAEARLVAVCDEPETPGGGYFFAPRVYEIERLEPLESEVFGPVLHVIRYRVEDLPRVYEAINASGYGLTLGVHSRIDGFAREVFRATRVGNTYINRDMVGAIVGVNPFGGQGLSGTGPKAGGPHYLPRFATEKTRTDNVVARGGNTRLFNLEEGGRVDG
jgi:RHH-type proline utilization regulon transcriptional repressor/proline dehydrogenase/delta 1-pyrroline-5-carboxylate dehydrogenase